MFIGGNLLPIGRRFIGDKVSVCDVYHKAALLFSGLKCRESLVLVMSLGEDDQVVRLLVCLFFLNS